MDTKIAVLIPCYNEALTVGKVINDWKNALPDAQIYVYDNNSTDETVAIAKSEGAIVRYEHSQGKGNVIRRMFREIDADCYIMIDGDDTYPANCAQEMARLVLEEDVDMVVGDRLSSTYYTQNKRPFHNFGNTLMKNSINWLFKSDIKDIMTGCRAFSYQFVKTFPVLSKGFDIETEMTLHAIHKNMRCKNVIIDYRDRPDGSESKLNTFSDGVKVIKTLIKFYKNYKPLGFFSVLAAILLLMAFIMFIPVFIEYIDTGMVDRFPTLITSGFITIAALQSFFAGLILHTHTEKDRQDFEFKLQLIEAERKRK